MTHMRLEQLHVLYHENLCDWNGYYTTRTCAIGTTIIPRKPVYVDDQARRNIEFLDLERCTLFLLACVISIDGINSFSIIFV